VTSNPLERDIHDRRGDRAAAGRWRARYGDGRVVDYVFSKMPGPGELPMSAWAGIARAIVATRHLGGIAFILVKRG